MIDENYDKLSLISECCVDTIKQHASNNPMMVCLNCKKIIKCFTEENEFDNYVKFCKSRQRKIFKGRFKKYFIVIRDYN